LAAKLGIGQAARRDPVGVRVRSPYKRRPRTIPYPPKVGQPKTPSSRARSVSDSQNCSTCSRRARSTTRCGSCPISLRLDVGRLFGGLSGSIAGVTWLTDQLGIRVFGTRLPREKRTGPAHERQCSAIIVPLRCFHQRSSRWENAFDSCGGRRFRHSHHDRANA
jgi:hypothetical protein